MAREQGSARYINILTSTGPDVYTKLCTLDTALNRDVAMDDVTDNCSTGFNEQLATTRTFSVPFNAVVKNTNLSYLKILEVVEDASPGDADYCLVTMQYVSAVYTYAGDATVTFSEAAAVGSYVRISGTLTYTGTVTRSAT